MKIKLGDVFELQMGKTPPRSNLQYWNGTHKWISIGDLGKAGKYINQTKEFISDSGVVESGIKLVPKGTVIMSFKLSIGKTAVTAEDMYTNEAIMAFIDKGICPMDADYIYHLFSGIDWSEGTNKAVLGATLNKATLSEKLIVIPDMEEQKYIAALLDRLDDLISLRKQQLAKLDELVKARFVEMFGDPSTNYKNFMSATLQELIEKKYIIYHLDGNHGSDYPRADEFTDTGVPYIGANCIENGAINLALAKHLPIERANTTVNKRRHF